jgi:hypothetical protein
MKYLDFFDTFPYADAASITGLVSETGHAWIGSGGCLPSIIDGYLTSSHPADYSALTAYRGSPYFDNCRAPDGNVYYCIANSTGNEPPNVTYWSAEGGNYAYVDVMQSPAYQYVDVEWEEEDGGIILSSSCRDNTLTWMTHFYFHANSLTLQMRGLGEGSPTTYGTVAYSQAVTLGEQYRVGVRNNGPRFELELPDGSIYHWTHQKFAQVTGRYLMFQPIHVKIHKAGCALQQRRMVA